MKMGTTEFSVRWKDHSNTISSVCKNLLDDNFLVDCTIAAEGQCLKAHRLILSACSPYFQLLFRQENDKHPIVFLKDTKFDELQAVIDFIYHGEVQISEDRLEEFLRIAESLQIKGLNDAARSNATRQRAERASNDSHEAHFSGSFAPGTKRSSTDSHSNYSERNPCALKESGIKKERSENTSHFQIPQLSEVCASSVISNTTVPLEESGNTTYRQINSPAAQPQMSSAEEFSSQAEQGVNSELYETILVEPKCEEMDGVNDESRQDYPDDNDSQEPGEQMTPEFCEQKPANHYPGVAPSFVNATHLPQDNSYMMPAPMPGHSNSQGDSHREGVEDCNTKGWQQMSQREQFPPPADVDLLKRYAVPTLPSSALPQPSAPLEVRLRSQTQAARPYKCRTCKVGFIQKAHLTTHMRRHTGEKPYKCDQCPAAFAESSNLKRHKRSHSGEKPYKCDLCGRCFTTSCQRLVHQRNRHHLCSARDRLHTY